MEQDMAIDYHQTYPMVDKDNLIYIYGHHTPHLTAMVLNDSNRSGDYISYTLKPYCS